MAAWDMLVWKLRHFALLIHSKSLTFHSSIPNSLVRVCRSSPEVGAASNSDKFLSHLSDTLAVTYSIGLRSSANPDGLAVLSR